MPTIRISADDPVKEEYDRIFGNNSIFVEKVRFWKKLEKIAITLTLISFGMIFSVGLIPLNELQGIGFFDLFHEYPLQASIFFSGITLFCISGILVYIITYKVSNIKRELGINREERLFLKAFEIHKNIDLYLDESKSKRRSYFKKLALEGTKEMIIITQKWGYGNVRLITELIGNKLRLFKDNLKRLVLSNVATGDETTLKKISEILVEFCKYLKSPTIKGLTEVNNIISELPFKEYQLFTRKERTVIYLNSRPRMSRILFAFSITTVLAIFFYCLGQNIGVIGVVAVASFWGALMGFDKIFATNSHQTS